MTFLYIHGFNSDGEGWKAQALRRQFPEAKVLAPDLPADPQAVMMLLEELVRTYQTSNFMLVGSSLGGFYAYCLSAKYQIPAWLFNPSLEPFQTLQGRGIGHFQTWTKQRDYHFKEEYLALLAAMRVAADANMRPTLLKFFLAADDETLDHSQLPILFPNCYINWYQAAGHRFSKFEKVLKTEKNKLS